MYGGRTTPSTQDDDEYPGLESRWILSERDRDEIVCASQPLLMLESILPDAEHETDGECDAGKPDGDAFHSTPPLKIPMTPATGRISECSV